MRPIEIQNFSKSYDDIPAVKNVSFSVEKGEIFGLIGPDGSGKTTLMRTICTLLVPEDGNIYLGDLDVRKHIPQIRSVIGYMPQKFSLYPDLTVEQNLLFFADLFNVSEVEKNKRLQQLFQFSRLEPFKKRQAQNLSGGMKQKLALSCALIHTPEILVLDEPTYGVDPVSRQEFWNLLKEIQKMGTTILVSTAYMDEANLCDRVGLMFKGEIKAIDNPDNLRQKYPYPLIRLKAENVHDLYQFCSNISTVRHIQLFGDSLHVSFDKLPENEDWLKWQKETGYNLKDWSNEQPSIEDIFLNLMDN